MAGNTLDKSLDNICVLVTRPAHQAQSLCAMIEKAGGKTVSLPVIEIAQARDLRPVQDILSRLSEFDIAIFISANAVHKTFELLNDPKAWPDTLSIAAIGRSTSLALEQHNKHATITPAEQFNSEGLLALDAMQHVSGKKIVIFRGEGGRELLADTLRQRGADVSYAEVYRRTRPNPDTSHIWRAHQIDIITVSSAEGLQNLYDMAGTNNQALLREIPLVVFSQRCAELAQKLGFRHPAIVSEEASDKGLVDALKQWYAVRPSS